MRMLVMFVALVFVVGVSEARAERASVVAAKAVSKAAVTVVKAVPKAPAAAWKCLKFVAAHA